MKPRQVLGKYLEVYGQGNPITPEAGKKRAPFLKLLGRDEFRAVVLKLFSGSIILLQINIQSIKKFNFGISKFSRNLYPIWPFCSFCFGRHCTTVQRTVV